MTFERVYDVKQRQNVETEMDILMDFLQRLFDKLGYRIALYSYAKDGRCLMGATITKKGGHRE